MLVRKLKNYISGYLSFEIEGLSHEKIINKSINKKLRLWDLKRVDYAKIQGYTRIKDYEELLTIAQNNGCSIKSRQKRGFPLFLSKVKRNLGIVIGFLIAVIIVFMFSKVIWKVEVQGNNIVQRDSIVEFLKKEGIGKGTFKNNIDEFYLRQELLVEFQDIIWIGMDINGASLIVNIKEREPEFKTIDKSKPTNIVAKKYGVIEKVVAKNGDAKVEKGDVVKKNQVLISGVIQRENLPTRLVTSVGTIQAKTYYVKEYETSRFEITKKRTGRREKGVTLKVFGLVLNINNKGCNFKDYIVDTNNKDVTLWRKFKLPVEIISNTYHEVVLKRKLINEELLKKSMTNYVNVNLFPEIPEEAEILNKSYKFRKSGDKIICQLTIEALEFIGEPKIINQIINPIKED